MGRALFEIGWYNSDRGPGVYEITDRGLSLLKTQPAEITVKTLRQFPEFNDFVGKVSETEPPSTPIGHQNEIKVTPEESLEISCQRK